MDKFTLSCVTTQGCPLNSESSKHQYFCRCCQQKSFPEKQDQSLCSDTIIQLLGSLSYPHPLGRRHSKCAILFSLQHIFKFYSLLPFVHFALKSLNRKLEGMRKEDLELLWHVHLFKYICFSCCQISSVSPNLLSPDYSLQFIWEVHVWVRWQWRESWGL